MNNPQSLSFWEHDSFFKNIDVVIIGSGIVGLNAALTIAERDPSVRVVVVERGALPEGASTRNAGFACFGSITELLDDLSQNSEEEVFNLVEKRYKGLKRLRQRVGDKNMTYEPLGGYEIFQQTEKDIYQNCADHLAYFNKNVKSIVGKNKVYQIKRHDFGFKNTLTNLIHNTAEGQIDTGKMMTTLIRLCRKKNIIFYNGLKINDLSDNYNTSVQGSVYLTTEDGWGFEAKKVIVATNGFARRLLPELAVLPARNQVLITKPITNLNVRGCFHYDKGYYYFRNVGNRVLFGGGRNLAIENEMTDLFGTTDLIQNTLENLLKTTILPHQPFEVDAWWSGILGIGAQKKPIIQHISPNIVVSVRMGGMGVAIGSLIGEEAATLALS